MASTYTMVAYGSQGSAVRQLQNELNKRGYSLDQDGIFGKKTRAAVRDYQKKNGLTMVDGIAGDETWGSLLSAPTAAEQAAQAAAAAEAAAPRAEVTAGTARRLQELEKGYTPSDEVTAAQAYRDSVAALEPGGVPGPGSRNVCRRCMTRSRGGRPSTTIRRRMSRTSGMPDCMPPAARRPWRTRWARRRP